MATTKPAVLAIQHSLLDGVGDLVVPGHARVYDQVHQVLQDHPALRGRIGAVVAHVWIVYYGLDRLIETKDLSSVASMIAGEYPNAPNYKTVSRNYHRVCEDYPALYVDPDKKGKGR